MELVVEFIRGYILEEELEIKEEEKNKHYSLHDLELALEFALINEGILSSEKEFDYANIISVRLHTLAEGENSIYFTYPKYVTVDEWVESLLTSLKLCGVFVYRQPEKLLLLQPFTTMQP